MPRLYHSFLKLPQNTRMVLVAIVGSLIGLATYKLLYWLLPFQPKATICWALSFFIGIARQHGLHRTFTFTYPTPYLKSLYRAYIMYSGSALVGIIVNFILTRIFSVHHLIAWLVCLFTTAGISFLLLQKKVFVPEQNTA